MQPDTLNVHIDLAALQANFFRRLQHQLDVTKILQVGCTSVTAEQVAEYIEFGTFVPANGAQLPHDQAKAEANHWLLRGFLRDAIESTGLFLDEGMQICELMLLVTRGDAKRIEVNNLLSVVSVKNHRLHLPQKLDKLERMFGVSTRFNPHILSLNRARNCVVHRQATVSPMDVDENGVLKLTFQRVNFVARGQQTGTKLLIDKPGIIVLEKSVLELHFVDSELIFSTGDRMELGARELYDTIITLWRFGITLTQAVEAYGKSVGISFN